MEHKICQPTDQTDIDLVITLLTFVCTLIRAGGTSVRWRGLKGIDHHKYIYTDLEERKSTSFWAAKYKHMMIPSHIRGGFMAKGPMRPPTPLASSLGPGPGEYVVTEAVSVQLPGTLLQHLCALRNLSRLESHTKAVRIVSSNDAPQSCSC